MSFSLSKRFPGGIFFVFITVILLNSKVQASTLSSADIDKSLEYIQSNQQSTSGGLLDVNPFSPSTDPQCIQSGWAAVAFASANIDPATVKTATDMPSLLDYIESSQCTPTTATDIERTILAQSASNITPSQDLQDKLDDLYDPTTGQIGPDIISTIFGVIAYKAYNHSVPDQTINYIIASQKDDGGWDDGYGEESNITAQAVMALADIVDNNSSNLLLAKTYLKSLQIDGGGIKYDSNSWTTASDANSDAYTLQAIYALGEDPLDNYWLINNKSIFDDLETLRQADGSYNFSSVYGQSLPVYTTVVVIPALTDQSLPIKPGTLNSFQIPNENSNETPPTTTENDISTPVIVNNTNQSPNTIAATTITTDQTNPITKSSTIIKSQPPTVFQDKSIISDNIDTTPTDINPTPISTDKGEALGANSQREAQSTNYNWYYILASIFGLFVGYIIYKLSIRFYKHV
jgi:hypothetical protein